MGSQATTRSMLYCNVTINSERATSFICVQELRFPNFAKNRVPVFVDCCWSDLMKDRSKGCWTNYFKSRKDRHIVTGRHRENIMTKPEIPMTMLLGSLDFAVDWQPNYASC